MLRTTSSKKCTATNHYNSTATKVRVTVIRSTRTYLIQIESMPTTKCLTAAKDSNKKMSNTWWITGHAGDINLNIY